MNPYCSYSFKRKWVKTAGSHKKSNFLFKCSWKGTFSTCDVTFNVLIPTADRVADSHLSLDIEFEGNIGHAQGERKARRITRTQRSELKKILAHEKPSTVYSTAMASLDDTMLSCGNRDGVGCSSSLYKKISSEAQRDQKDDPDLRSSLSILKRRLGKEVIGGYIQKIGAEPFRVMFTYNGVRMYHHLGDDNTLYLDATGTIVSMKNTNYDSQRVLYYALVMKNPTKCQPPVALAEYVTCDHTVLSVSHFLEVF